MCAECDWSRAISTQAHCYAFHCAATAAADACMLALGARACWRVSVKCVPAFHVGRIVCVLRLAAGEFLGVRHIGDDTPQHACVSEGRTKPKISGSCMRNLIL